jgi:pilus assembly protein CpaE
VSESNSRAIILETSGRDLDVIRRKLEEREYTEILTIAWPEATKVLHNGGSGLAVVPIEEGDDAGISRIEEMKRLRPEIPIIATGPAPIPDLILRAIRAGAIEFLVRPIQSSELGQALDRVSIKTGLGSNYGKCVAVYSAKGGIGGTTVAVNTAFALARSEEDRRVALVDLVVLGGDIRIFLDIRPERTIRDLAEDIDTMARHELMNYLHSCEDGVWVCPDPNLPDEGELLTGRRVVSVLRRLTQNFGFTIVDCEHTLNERTLAVLDFADEIVLLTHLTLPAVRGLQRTLDIFARLNYPPEKVRIVVNRHGSKGDLTLSDLEKVVERPVTATIPNDYKATIDAAARGLPIYQSAPKSKIASALDRLASTLNTSDEDEKRDAPNGKGSRLFRRKTEA